MGKISPVSSKYIVHATIEIEGVVDRPDVIGAIFGQTEGLLGADLELRELQRSGRIGRIEVNTETRGGKTQGAIIIPSSLDKAETAIIAAALEVIQRIGPCNAKVRVHNIEDVRVSKRSFVIERAKVLLKDMIESVMPDSQEIADEVINSVRVMEIVSYGPDKLPAGPGIDESDEVIIVEGRADVLNLLKHGFKNVVAMNGTSVPQTVIDLTREKDVIVFLDGDRGGNLILKELINVAEVDFVARAPDGKEVEELAKKEIHKALRSKVNIEQAKHEMVDTSESIRKPTFASRRPDNRPPLTPLGKRLPPRPPLRTSTPLRPATTPTPQQSTAMTDDEKKKFGKMLEDLIGTRGAYLLDEKLNILGKVPLSELTTTMKSLNSGVYAVIFDGTIDADIASTAEEAKVKHVVGMDAKIRKQDFKLNILTAQEL